MAVPNRGPEIQAACYTLLVAAVTSTLLRCYVRARMVKNFGLDDWFMVAALITFTLFVIFTLVGVQHGTGHHRSDLSDADFEIGMKVWWFCYIWYIITMIMSKLSIGYFLIRITVKKIHKFIVYGAMMASVIMGTAFLFVTLFQCRPISFFWNKDLLGTCVDIDVIIALTYLYSTVSLVSDLTYAILPMFLIWNLNMDLKSKIALVPIMTMACVASAAVAVRLPYVKDFRDPDFLWSTVDLAVWSAAEQGLAVAAGSFATLRPLLRAISRKLGLSSTGPSEIQDSERAAASRFGGHLSHATGYSNPQQGPFSLTTFACHGDDEYTEAGGEAGDSGSGQMGKSSIEKGASGWGSRRPTSNESEEELTGPGHEGRTGNSRPSIKITTTLRMEEHRV
ncbi:hypothetical protein BKA56DRAFT_550770 [Ilyonectria sp. MPI-CAGE-AT-0026]|nr:hypothetical protein BKA56DRAFT_550770 [Ilyonectria sp. MPI-CAGE-AT-0026]